jgi:hypothetical protein
MELNYMKTLIETIKQMDESYLTEASNNLWIIYDTGDSTQRGEPDLRTATAIVFASDLADAEAQAESLISDYTPGFYIAKTLKSTPSNAAMINLCGTISKLAKSKKSKIIKK